jgi:CheY-like chemotaxis protein
VLLITSFLNENVSLVAVFRHMKDKIIVQSFHTPLMRPSLIAPFKRVMSIDDNTIDHFVIRHVITKENFAKEVIFFASAEEAVIYLINNKDNITALPEIILLDINMPGMNGFDFLEEFSKLNGQIKAHCKIVMLSSSISATDKETAKRSNYVKLYMNKPLTSEKLEKILTAFI